MRNLRMACCGIVCAMLGAGTVFLLTPVQAQPGNNDSDTFNIDGVHLSLGMEVEEVKNALAEKIELQTHPPHEMVKGKQKFNHGYTLYHKTKDWPETSINFNQEGQLEVIREELAIYRDREMAKVAQELISQLKDLATKKGKTIAILEPQVVVEYGNITTAPLPS